MNLAYFSLICDHATDAVMEWLDLGRTYREQTGGSIFVVEAHLTYDREVSAGDEMRVETLAMECGAKKMRLFHRLLHAGSGEQAATNEALILHVDLNTRRVAPWPADGMERIRGLVAAHQDVARPPEVGRHVGARRG